jgi:sugar phosphate isomerase/epimerase
MYKCLNPSTVGITLDWEACLSLAKDHGFGGIDIPINPEVAASYYLEKLEQYDLKPGGMILNFHVLDDESIVSQALSRLPEICERAQQVGQTRLYTWILSYSDQLTWMENFSFHVQRLGKAARILDDYDCRLGLEFLGPKTIREGHRFSFIHNMQAMLELAEAIGSNVGLLLDAWHWYTSLGTVEELHNLKNRQVVYVHINDAPAGIPIEQQQDSVRCLPGDTGVIDIAGFLNALRRIGYDGPVVPEPFVRELNELPPETVAQRVSEAMDRVWFSKPQSFQYQ